MSQKKLPLRIGIGAIVLNSENKIFVGKRLDNPVDKWQMPQGGVDKGENLTSAMRRELMEETSIQNIKILKQINKWFTYELPKDLLGIIWKGKFRGQKQKWFLVRFLGNESEINLKTKHPEFIEWKWIEVEELTRVVVSFKRDVYKKLVIELKKFID